MKESEYGGVIICLAAKGLRDEAVHRLDVGPEIAVYTTKTGEGLLRFKGFVEETKGGQRVYCPARALSVHRILGVSEGLRFLGDNQAGRGKYYPGFAIGVENYEDMVSKPVDEVLIFSMVLSRVTGDRVEKVPPNTRVQL